MSKEQKSEIPVSFEQMIENEITAKGLTAPRVTKEQIDTLFSKLQFVLGRVSETRILCTATLDGFVIADGASAVVDPKNFDEEIGKKIAHKKCAMNAYDKLWEFEGYRLARSLVENKQ
jgi:hypothetical protein